ncbi:MAG: tagatose 1,6-diphosphate aldolase [Acidimicrobiia bacterium]
MNMTPGKLWGLRRLADNAGRFKMVAVDQRPPIKDLVRAATGTTEASYKDVAQVKRLLVEELAPYSTAALLDPHYAYPTAIDAVSPHRGLLVTLEDSVFEETARGRKSAEIDNWSVDKIRRIGADAVKVLAWYRPDADTDVNEHQRHFVARIGEVCRRYDIPFLFELLVYSFPDEDQHDSGYVEQVAKRADHVVESVETFADPVYGIDVFKLESPIPAATVPDANGEDTAASARAQALFNQLDRASSVPWVMLSAGAEKEAFLRILTYAYRSGASGFLAGRAIWWDEVQAFPDLDAARRNLRAKSVPYMKRINDLTDELAMPFAQHRSFGSAGPQLANTSASFRANYGSIAR